MNEKKITRILGQTKGLGIVAGWNLLRGIVGGFLYWLVKSNFQRSCATGICYFVLTSTFFIIIIDNKFYCECVFFSLCYFADVTFISSNFLSNLARPICFILFTKVQWNILQYFLHFSVNISRFFLEQAKTKRITPVSFSNFWIIYNFSMKLIDRWIIVASKWSIWL